MQKGGTKYFLNYGIKDEKRVPITKNCIGGRNAIYKGIDNNRTGSMCDYKEKFDTLSDKFKLQHNKKILFLKSSSKTKR